MKHRNNACCTDASPLRDFIGAAEQPQGDVRGSAADRQDSASQGQQEIAQSLQADSAPGSSTGPDGPPSVSKGGRRGGSKSIASAPKRQMNFWQEEEKAQFLNAYRVSKSFLLVLLHPALPYLMCIQGQQQPCASSSPCVLFGVAHKVCKRPGVLFHPPCSV